MSVPRVYIAGPMRGKPDLNFPEFNRVAAEWRAAGFEVINPAELDGGDVSQPFSYYIKRDIQALLTCDAIVLLKGWSDSQGARVEQNVAEACGLLHFEPWDLKRAWSLTVNCPRLFTMHNATPRDWLKAHTGTYKVPLDECFYGPEESPKTVCQEADSLIHGDRRADYGHPLDDYSKVVGAFNSMTGLSLTVEQAILFMQCVKLSRQQNKPKRDNLVDLCGYTGLLEMIADEKARRSKEQI